MKYFFLYLVIYLPVFAHEDMADSVKKENFKVYGRYLDLSNSAVSASEGSIGQSELSERPLSRTGEMLELIPGMMVTQHSGSGKANQYFIRGFNLDHGTDFSFKLDSMPINMRSHGHGQGYADMNFIMPELLENIHYHKGPYYADIGDFSGAGGAFFRLKDTLEEGFLKLELGQYEFYRLLLADSFQSSENSHLIYAFEGHSYDGPWTGAEENVEKFNAYIRNTWKFNTSDRFALTFLAYNNNWDSVDQIAERAVKSGLVDRYGSLNESNGGRSSRYSLSADLTTGPWDISAYYIKYDLKLWSDFTYFLDDPVNGDQFRQSDDREILGSSVKRSFSFNLGGLEFENILAYEFQYDRIPEVALKKTSNRQILSTVREDEVDEMSHSAYLDSNASLTDNLRLNLGLRYDFYSFRNNSNLSVNSGQDSDGIGSAKINLMYDFNDFIEVYAGIGQGFHSNDARGVSINVDPSTMAAIDDVDPLVRTWGAEAGIRYFDPGNFNASFGLWLMESDSELLFVGDAGTTEASRSSRRYGLEMATVYWINENWIFDLETTLTDSRFTENEAGEGQDIEGSLPFTLSTGINFQMDRFYSSIRMRYYGRRPLDSNSSTESDTAMVFNWHAGYRWDDWELKFSVFNLLDSKDNDIEYLYESRLAGEPAGGVEDVHSHPFERRSARLSLTYYF